MCFVNTVDGHITTWGILSGHGDWKWRESDKESVKARLLPPTQAASEFYRLKESWGKNKVWKSSKFYPQAKLRAWCLVGAQYISAEWILIKFKMPLSFLSAFPNWHINFYSVIWISWDGNINFWEGCWFNILKSINKYNVLKNTIFKKHWFYIRIHTLISNASFY